MKHHNMLPYRRVALAAAALVIAHTSAQWGGQSQQYCSNQNTGSDYSPVNDIYNSYQACSDNCKSNYAFAVVQWQDCWCSDYIPADQGDTGDCNQDCPGYPGNSCGNSDSGLFGYIALEKSPSGTAGGGSSSQASSTAAPTSSSVRVSTSTTSSSSSRREQTSSSAAVFSSSTSSQIASSSSSSDYSSSDSSSPPTSSSTTQALTSSSQTSSPETTSTSYSSSRDPTTSSSAPPTTSSTSSSVPRTTSSSTPPPSTSSTYSPVQEATTASSTSSYIPEDATPSPVTSTRVVTISGEAVTQTVTSTPMVVPFDKDTEAASSNKSLSGGAIAGIVIAVLAFLALLALVIFLLWRRRRQQTDPKNPHGYPEMATAANPRPKRNVSVLSKVGLLARSNHDPNPDDDAEPSSAGPSHSARHSAFFAAGGAGGSDGVSPSSPLGPQSNASASLYQMDSRRHSKPLVYDQRLNPSALFANADANGSRISMADNTDYSRPLDFGTGKLAVRNPDPRASFESRA